jgi:hypothetical protein
VRNPPADAVASSKASINGAASRAGRANSATSSSSSGAGYESNYFDTLAASARDEDMRPDEDGLVEPERKVLDMVADSLARLGRVKRVGLGVREKARFVDVWRRGSRARRQ